MKPTHILTAFLLLSSSLNAEPRTWTAKDGRSLIADYVSSAQDTVTVRRNDGTTLSIPLALLSEEDVSWINRQPKPVEVSQEQLNKLIAAFPKAPALTNGEVTNDLKQLHDKYESLVKFTRANTMGANLKLIRAKIAGDIEIYSAIARTATGDGSGKRGSTQSKGAENAILSARRSQAWLQTTLTTYLLSFDALLENTK